jgi:hypothetical protein
MSKPNALLAAAAPAGVEASTALPPGRLGAQSSEISGNKVPVANAIAPNTARGPAHRRRARSTVRKLTRER